MHIYASWFVRDIGLTITITNYSYGGKWRLWISTARLSPCLTPGAEYLRYRIFGLNIVLYIIICNAFCTLAGVWCYTACQHKAVRLALAFGRKWHATDWFQHSWVINGKNEFKIKGFIDFKPRFWALSQNEMIYSVECSREIKKGQSPVTCCCDMVLIMWSSKVNTPPLNTLHLWVMRISSRAAFKVPLRPTYIHSDVL